MTNFSLLVFILLAVGAGCSRHGATLTPICGTNPQLTSNRAGGQCNPPPANGNSNSNANGNSNSVANSNANANSNSNSNWNSGTNSGPGNANLPSEIALALSRGDATIGAGNSNAGGNGALTSAQWQQINQFVAAGGQFAAEDHYPIIGAGSGPGAGPIAEVWVVRPNQDPQRVFHQFVFDPSTRYGVQVAFGDVSGDGSSDLIVSQGHGGDSTIKVIDGRTGSMDALDGTFAAYEPGMTNGVFVDTADFDGDRKAEIIAGTGVGGGPRVRIFQGSTVTSGNSSPTVIADFYAFDPGSRAGVTVAAGDVDGDGSPELIVGKASTGTADVPEANANVVRVFKYTNGSFVQLYEFNVFGGLPQSGAYVAGGDIDGDGKADIIVGQVTGGSRVEVHSGANPSVVIASFDAYESTFTGGATVASGFLQLVNQGQVVTGASASGGPAVSLWSLLNGSIGCYDAFFTIADPNTYRKGISVAASLFL